MSDYIWVGKEYDEKYGPKFPYELEARALAEEVARLRDAFAAINADIPVIEGAFGLLRAELNNLANIVDAALTDNPRRTDVPPPSTSRGRSIP